MQNNKRSVSNYYREHTRQQDGWTVLVRLPQAAQAGPDLPPPYTPEAAPPLAAGPAAPEAAPGLLAFDIPTNANVIGATQVSHSKKYSCAVPFNTAFVEICSIMGLDHSVAQIGYKWDNEKAHAPIHGLLSATDWKDCLESGIGMMQRARTRQVKCVIKNLNPPEETAAIAKTAGKKRKEPSSSSSNERKTYDFTREYRELKNHLSCAKHKGDLCYIHEDGHHIRVEPSHATLWAKEISIGNAKRTRPPENIIFQEYFLPERKRARTGGRSESSHNPFTPTINVTMNTAGTSGGGGAPSAAPPRSPLACITAATANAANIDVPLVPSHTYPDNSSSSSICYPTVTDVLQSIDKSGIFEDAPFLPFPAVIFSDALHTFEITHVDQVPILDSQFYIDQVNMPQELAEHFVKESFMAMEQAQKGKGKAHF
ncbi:hypothetical protein C8R44DRAFT_883400 [Mycena epipterygia]|nr:hypothetical protein C8R44DRAFT_883400 [Mycena epipterygia]